MTYFCLPVLTLLCPAKFLFDLGLKHSPLVSDLLTIAAKGEPEATLALNHFLDHDQQEYYWYSQFPQDYDHIAFIPTIYKGGRELKKRPEVFSNPNWQLLGFPILDPSLRQDAAKKLLIEEHPPTHQLVSLIKESPPTTEDQACKLFGVLSSQIPGLSYFQSSKCVYQSFLGFTTSQLAELSKMPIIPTLDNSPMATSCQLLPPNQCYFRGKSPSKFHSQLFTFVDFGTSANSFLKACGTKGEPSVEDIALALLRDPQKFFQLIEGWDK